MNLFRRADMSRKREEINPECGLRLKSILASNGIAQKELAAKLGYTEQHISQIIKGKRRLTPEMVQKISELDIPNFRPEWLLAKDNIPTEDERLRTIAKIKDETPRLIFRIMEMHNYILTEERVVCRKSREHGNQFDSQFPPGMSLENVFNALQKDGEFPQEMSYSEFLEEERKKGADSDFYFRPILALRSPKGSKVFLDKTDFDKIVSEIDDFVEFKCAFLFKRTVSKATNLYELG